MPRYIKLRRAALCADCDTIFDFDEIKRCPCCASYANTQVSTWLPTLKGEDLVLDYEPRIEVPSIWATIIYLLRNAPGIRRFALTE